MAEQTSAVPSAISKLQEALSDPEPMCLAVVEVSIGDGLSQAAPASDQDYGCDTERSQATIEVVEQAQERLRETLRDYDELKPIDDERFALVLRTLADASIMSARMEHLLAIMAKPYLVGGQEVEIPVHLGASIRTPQERPSELLERVERALQQARSAGGPDQVML
jgi:GGDEF domain-containing protein